MSKSKVTTKKAGMRCNSRKGLVIGLVLLSVVVVLMVAGFCFLYQRWYKPRNKNGPASEMSSLRNGNRNPDDDQAEVMYNQVRDGDAGSSDETRQYACVDNETCPGISDVIMTGSNPGPIGAPDREYMDVDISSASNSTSNHLHEQTGSTQHAPLYAEVKKAKAVAGIQKVKVSPDQTVSGPLYAQVNKQGGGPVYARVNKTSPDKPDVGPVYAEVNKPKNKAASPDTSETRGVYVTAQDVWGDTDAHS